MRTISPFSNSSSSLSMFVTAVTLTAGFLEASVAFADGAPVIQAGLQAVVISAAASKGAPAAEIATLSPAAPSTTKRQSRYQISSTGQIGDLSALNWKQEKNHVYVILPLTSDISMNSSSPGKLKIRSASGLDLIFRNGTLEGITDADGGAPCNFAVNKAATLSERDFTISSCKSRMIFDAGIGHGGGAYANPAGTTKVTDENGHSCSVPNSSLFTKISKWDARFNSQAQVIKALKAAPACASLSLKSLEPATARATTKRPSLSLPYLESNGSR